MSWGDPCRTGTAFDFRTDAITTPSIRQLAAITRATLNDDVFGEDASTTLLEQHVATICGCDAAAFVMSGTMANQLSLAALTSMSRSRPCAVLADSSAHVVNFEAGGLSNLSGAAVQPVQPSNGLYLRAEDIEKHAKLGDNMPWEVCPTAVVSLENTAHGNLIPLRELRGIRDWTAQAGILVHIDGARVWDAVAAGGGSLRDIAACSDAMTLSFAKGIGAPIGAAVVGSSEVIRRVKRLRQSIGGGVRKAGVLAAAAMEAVLENFGPGDVDVCRVIQGGHSAAAEVSNMWTARGGKLLRPTETNMVWLDLAAAGVAAETVSDMASRRGVLLAAPRVVLHHQICADALVSLGQVFDDILAGGVAAVDAADLGVRSKGCVQAM
ncbi:alanine racemase [Echria macrotheca]|uniref:Alanine racemase n=1 Tax=Echria macrotheca TaxID=438768 RepID=A0AAJ0BKR9_9PEZI|nr:alanine racemase [Echria macrotheca]